MISKRIVGISISIVIFTALIIWSIFNSTQLVLASAPSGLPATVATSSIADVGTTATTLFATSSCAARIITTVAKPIMLTFSDYSAQTPTATFGHYQAASTTVVYDSGQYGCGLVKVYGFDSTTTITVTETR